VVKIASWGIWKNSDIYRFYLEIKENWRNIAIFVNILNQIKQGKSQGYTIQTLTYIQLKNLFSDMLEPLGGFLPKDEDDFFEKTVALCIYGGKVILDDKVQFDYRTSTVADLIEKGYLSQHFEFDGFFQPKMSFFSIKYWSLIQKHSTRFLVSTLKQMCEQLDQFQGFYSLEIFNAYWIAIKIFCLSSITVIKTDDNDRLKILNYDGNMNVGKDFAALTLGQIFGSNGLKSMELSTFFDRITLFKPFLTVTDKYTMQDISILNDEEIIRYVFLLSGNNSGFDSCFFGKDNQDGSLRIFCIENRASNDKSSTEVTDQEIGIKAILSWDNIQSTLNKSSMRISKDNFFFIFCPWRKPSLCQAMKHLSWNYYMGFGPDVKNINIYYLRKDDLNNSFGPLSPENWYYWSKK